MIRRPPRSTLTDTPLPDTTPSDLGGAGVDPLAERDAAYGGGSGRQDAGADRGPQFDDGDSDRSRAAFYRQGCGRDREWRPDRSEEHTSELQSLMRISYAVFCLKKKNQTKELCTL